MNRSARQKVIVFGTVAVVGAAVLLSHRPAYAQSVERPKGPGDIHFETKIGSFKLLGTENGDVTGDFTMTATGTLLISGLDEPPVIPGMKLEYVYKPLKKYCYHGSGTLTLKNATFRNLQWFGTNLTAAFHGRGKVRMVGEFDKNLSTGTYWTTDPKSVDYWTANNVIERLVPPYEAPKSNEVHQVPVK